VTASVWFEFTHTETVIADTGQSLQALDVYTSITADGVTVPYYSSFAETEPPGLPPVLI
jgi:hypothetical protein